MVRFCTILLILLLNLTTQSWSQPATAITVPPADEKLKTFLEGLETFSADFEQTLFNEFNETLETASGSVYLQRPGKFHWVYTAPYSQYLISDGTDLWIYDQDLEQVTVSTVTGTIEKSPAAVLAGDTDLGGDYIINDLGHLDGADWMELASADPESQYNSIRLGFDGQRLVGMILFDNLGQTTRIVFSHDVRNGAIDPSLFQFTPPAGVDVIDNRPAADTRS